MFYNQSQKESEAPRIKVLTRKEKKKRDTTENHSNFEQLGRDICATKINFIAHGFIKIAIRNGHMYFWTELCLRSIEYLFFSTGLLALP